MKNNKVQSVNKGQWDKLVSDNDAYVFTYEWLSTVREKMADNATLWVSGTHREFPKNCVTAYNPLTGE
ncbi:hypothetical protein [Psychrobacter nivimaris]|uniref:hypothetical protein n=1 Tax=Psychrobacter nivimaris TaxID=281738 RepID=UPI0019191FA4|nr:hypothetical protein [Psychrobacter nivimaris]